MSLTSCPDCGKVVSDMFQFCPVCGTKIISKNEKIETGENNSQSTSRRRFPIVTICITTAIALAILLIMQYSGIIDLRVRNIGQYDEDRKQKVFDFISSATQKGIITKVDLENKAIYVDFFAWNHLNPGHKKEAVNNFAAYMEVMGSETATVRVLDHKSESVLATRGLFGTSLK